MLVQLELGDITIDVIQKDIKNVHLSVNPPHGNVRISAPISMSFDAIRAFAIDKLVWIKSERKKFLAQEREPVREFLDRESHYVWGKRYMLEIVEVDETPSVELKHSQLVLKVRPGTDRSKMRSLLDEWYREKIKAAVPELVAKYSNRLKVSIDRLFVQDMKTQWGGCNPSRNNIRLNTDLARKSPEYLEYVVLHEMAHLLEPTHNDRFTAIMDAQMPNWRQYRDELNRLPLKAELE
ncbi:MAG: M48 family metallopeptidase [Oligoflexia bacterium]|nr:M48 family metallopeptidase [Oligoflexia bacterium]